ncbi:unnamed protein product [Rhizoctonia solani]|nr:unnamed protein product [Rhizoctonia solani]
MIDHINPSVHPAICEWEEAGVSLVTSVTNYFNLSRSLEEKAISEGTPPTDLAKRIDSALATMQITLENQIALTRSTLAHTRNRIKSSIVRLPREILSEIFMLVVFDALGPTEREGIKTNVIEMYLELYTLLGVCKVWRDILLNRGEFWSLVPVLGLSPHTCGGKHRRIDLDYVLSCITERSHSDLRLLATEPCDPSYQAVLKELAPRFRAVNIATKDQATIRDIMGIFLGPESPQSLALAHLSLYQDHDQLLFNEPPPEESYIFSLGSQEQESFEKLALGLSVLRLRGAQCHWDRFSFSNQLTKLHLQDVGLGYEPTVTHFLSALTSATELRTLKLISVRVLYDGPLIYSRPARRTVQFPNLQTLLLDDLSFNTIDYFLSSITSRSHRLTLFISKRCQLVNLFPRQSPGAGKVTWGTLCELLSQVSVHELLVCGMYQYSWPSPAEIGELVKLISPDLETLRIDSWDFDTQGCDMISHYSLSHGSKSPPSLINLHITRAKIIDQEAFLNMLTSYSGSVQRMVLGAIVCQVDETQYVTVKRDHPLVFALENAVPDFRLVSGDFTPLEVVDAPWELW